MMRSFWWFPVTSSFSFLFPSSAWTWTRAPFAPFLPTFKIKFVSLLYFSQYSYVLGTRNDNILCFSNNLNAKIFAHPIPESIWRYHVRLCTLSMVKTNYHCMLMHATSSTQVFIVCNPAMHNRLKHDHESFSFFSIQMIVVENIKWENCHTLSRKNSSTCKLALRQFPECKVYHARMYLIMLYIRVTSD